MDTARLAFAHRKFSTGRHCPKCKCGVIYTGERDVEITIIYDHQHQAIDVGRIVTPYCGGCFRVLPHLDPDA